MELVTRYSAAWGEHSARVAQRQQVFQTFFTLVLALFGYYYLSKKPASAVFDARRYSDYRDFCGSLLGAYQGVAIPNAFHGEV